MSKQSYTYASPLLGVEGASGLLCFRSLSLQGEVNYGNSTPCCWGPSGLNMFQIIFTSVSIGLCVRPAFRTFRLTNAGGSAEHISFHPSSYVKLHIITVKLQLTSKSSLTYQFMFISITFPNIARLHETMEAWLSSWINANWTLYNTYFLFDMLLEPP